MKNKVKSVLIFSVILILILGPAVYAHGGNISGWKDKNSSNITKYNGKYYGYHKENGATHYHQVEWSEEKSKWEIISPAVYYDEKFNVINTDDSDKSEKTEVKFYKKVDGDTAKFKLKDEIITIRFLGINTPETVDKNRGEEPFGKEASQYTEEKLKNASKIEIEYDTNASEKDKYDRILAWIWVDDSLLQEELVSNGLAETYMLQNNYKYAGKLQLAQEDAKNKNLGIWSEGGKTDKNDENILINDEELKDKIIIIMAGIIFILLALLGGYKIKKTKK